MSLNALFFEGYLLMFIRYCYRPETVMFPAKRLPRWNIVSCDVQCSLLIAKL